MHGQNHIKVGTTLFYDYYIFVFKIHILYFVNLYSVLKYV